MEAINQNSVFQFTGYATDIEEYGIINHIPCVFGSNYLIQPFQKGTETVEPSFETPRKKLGKRSRTKLLD